MLYGQSRGTQKLLRKGLVTVSLKWLYCSYLHLRCAHCHTSLALQEVSVDLRLVLGVAVHTNGGPGGSMYICWALAQKQVNQKSQTQYLVHDVLGSSQAILEGHHEAVLYTANSKGIPGNAWYPAFSEGKGPNTDTQYGNKFFPHIQVKSSDKTFKVYCCHYLHFSYSFISL